ncbi:hypothetical protein KO02_11455 [Sphingobacterium sp. ML3W]|nr:hypothetical protein KO02_11455 [Sphingobacterium sp. ML3W]
MSCKKDPRVGPYIYDITTSVNVLDEQGNDLLDPSVKVEKSIDINKIQLSYIIGGNERIQSPGVRLVEPTDEYENYSLQLILTSVKKSMSHY